MCHVVWPRGSFSVHTQSWRHHDVLRRVNVIGDLVHPPVRAGGSRRMRDGRPNGLEVHLRGQGPRAEADAAHGVHACESRDAGRAPPCCF